MRYWIIALFLLTPVLPAQSAEPTSWNFGQLMQKRAQVQNARAGFVETRKMSSGETLKTSGVLIYRSPGVLERQTERPFPERIVIENDRMTMEMETSPGQIMRREFSLSRIPAMRPFFIGLRSMLAGDAETLQRLFDVTLDGDESAWTIKLVPRENADKQTREIVFSGHGNDLNAVELRQKNGDSSHTTITPVSIEMKSSSSTPKLSRGS
jgi:outer membrane lipoprotein-sorting protein